MKTIPMNTDTMTERPDSNIYASIFGPSPEAQAAAAARDASFQDWLNSRKQAVEQQRTDDVRMARLNAIGNVLTTMVQPLGWAIGGQGKATGGVQPIDNRQYLQAFERAMKANDDLRNIGTLEGEYQFKLADEDYRRARAIEDYQNKAQIELQKQQQIFDMRSQLSQQQMEERIKVAEATAKAKFQFKTAGGGRATESVRDNFLKRANAKYLEIVADYEKKKNLNIEGLQPPKPYDQFIKEYGPTVGITVDEGSGSSASSETPSPAGGSASSKTPPSKQKRSENGNSGANSSKTPPSKRNK